MQGTEVNTNVQSQLNVIDNLNGTLARDKDIISSSFPSNRYKDKRSYTFDDPTNNTINNNTKQTKPVLK